MNDNHGPGLTYLPEDGAAGAEALDTCWNIIGVRGDNSCPRLVEYIRCLNCPVFANAATVLLDRYSLQREPGELVYAPAPEAVPTRSLVVFRLGGEWLGLATRCLVEVAPHQPVHSVPHQRSRTLLGVANVRGALVPCIALHELLGVEQAQAPATPGRVLPRMLILAAQGGSVVAPVDEIDGIRRFEQRLIDAGASEDSNRFTASVLTDGQRTLRVLDEQALMAAITRSLT
ncbi:chemotaxis protein CheW [Pseudomonas sp. RIT-PI-S]|uniref:chemotaxis protein CheW n=1 Tax=Pseudomonas sp. RIT-PI-S TaxID=3035295 RepID=UPI0021DB5068|nr:chemotaxis protein CheW [Pseudomonas sp. RIT-PI-S]